LNAPHDERVRSKLCDLADWKGSDFASLSSAIMGTDPEHLFYHRKLWEFTRLVQALQAMGIYTPNAIGLSVAAGHERVLYYLARHLHKVVATDVYGDSAFSQNEANSQVLASGDGYAPYDYPKEHLKFLYMNALQLDFPAGLFDFAFCLSSIEHFGGVRNASLAIREMARVVRPGGLVFVTTDCSLNGNVTNEVFSRKEIERLLAENTNLSLLAPFTWDVSQESLQHVLNMRRDDLTTTPHINLRLFGTVFTSISLVFQKCETTEPPLHDRAARLERELERLEATPPTRSPLQHPSLIQHMSRRAYEKLRGGYYRLQEAQWLLERKLFARMVRVLCATILKQCLKNNRRSRLSRTQTPR
jgi:SAM-dependent methyltransferase